jgi:anti-sigma-K factor RskA
MPSLPEGRTLQLWFLPKKGPPMSIAIFRPDSSGQITVIAPVNMPSNEIAGLAITEEPAMGSPQPTSSASWMARVNEK